MPIQLVNNLNPITNTNTDIIVNTVNCVGVMGAGIALQVKQKYPKMFKQYVNDCKNGLYKAGCIKECLTHNHIIINMATKNHWQSPSKIEWIEQGLKELLNYLQGTTYSITIPPIGCTNGKLDWNDVKPIIETILGNLDNQILLMNPNN